MENADAEVLMTIAQTKLALRLSMSMLAFFVTSAPLTASIPAISSSLLLYDFGAR